MHFKINFHLQNPDLLPNTDDAFLLNKIYRSLDVTLNDLNQLQTTFLQTFENHFQPYCDKSASKFTNLGTIIYNLDRLFASLLTVMPKRLSQSFSNCVPRPREILRCGAELFGIFENMPVVFQYGFHHVIMHFETNPPFAMLTSTLS